jgi:hypothetical protein
MEVNSLALRSGRPLRSHQRRFLVLVPVRGRVNLRAIVRLDTLSKLRKSSAFIGSRNRDLPVCSVLPQPTTLTHNLLVSSHVQFPNRNCRMLHNNLLHFIDWITTHLCSFCNDSNTPQYKGATTLAGCLWTIHLTTRNTDRCPDSANTSAEVACVWQPLTS